MLPASTSIGNMQSLLLLSTYEVMENKVLLGTASNICGLCLCMSSFVCCFSSVARWGLCALSS